MPHSSSVRRFLAAIKVGLGFFLCSALAAGTSFAQGIPIPVNQPQVLTGDITPGMTNLDIPFAVSGADGLSMEVIAPVNGVTLSLVGPGGHVVVPVGDPRVHFTPGSALPNSLPGGVFMVDEVAAPADGNWIIRLAFPGAPQKTVAMATITARSRYQVGIVIERTTLLVGEDVSIGIIVLDNGTPITGLSPTLSIGLGAPTTPFAARDDGAGLDGLANDGVYSIAYTFGSAGTYQIQGDVVIPTATGNVVRQATLAVAAIPPALDVTTVVLNKVLGSGGCVTALQVGLTENVQRAGNYVTRVQLGANGKTLDARKSQPLALGTAQTTLQFTAADLKQKLAASGTFNVNLIETLEVTSQEFLLAYRRRDAGSFELTPTELCTASIGVEEQLTVTPVLKAGFIDSLNLAFPVTVRTAGSYQISLKMVGPGGEDIRLINASRALAAGRNIVTANVSSPNFRSVDGPYRAISLLVFGGGSSARLSTLGATPAYLRWQFYPAITGDLTNDGAVDAADEALLTSFRGQKSLVPGDRRDFNKDGVIDIRDIRELQKHRCAVGVCPVNP